MADLSPDLSPYQALARPAGGLGSMDPASLLGLIQHARQLSTQSGVAGAIRSNPNDPTAAYGAAAANPNVFMGPEDVSSFVHAQKAQSDLNKFYMGEAASAMSSLYTKSISKTGATLQDFYPMATMLTRYGVPASMITDTINSAADRTGRLDPIKLNTMLNWISANGGLPQQQGMTETGRTVTQPEATARFGGAAGGPVAQPGVVTTNTPAGSAVGAGAGQDYRADTVAARNFPQDVTPLRHIIAGLESGTITGRSTEEVNNLKNFVHSMGIDTMFGADVSKGVVPYEELRKYMIRAADLASAGGTNDRLAAAVSGNPNAKLLTASNLDLAKVNLALRRMQQVGYQEFQKQLSSGASINGRPLQYEDYSNWYTQWAAKQDNRAFVHDLLDPKGKARVFGTFNTTGEADAYQASWRAMHQNHPEIERAGAP